MKIIRLAEPVQYGPHPFQRSAYAVRYVLDGAECWLPCNAAGTVDDWSPLPAQLVQENTP